VSLVTDLVLTSSDASLTVSLANGGRLASLVIAGLDVIGRGGDRLVDWGCYAMAPYAGRVRNGRLVWEGKRHQLPIQMAPHAIHGVTIDRPWQVIEATASTASLRCGFDSRWPWHGHAVQHLTLTDDGLDAVLEVHSHEEAFPAWTGYHPWFARRLSRGEPVRIFVPSGGLMRKDADGMPTTEIVPIGDGPFDDCFVEVGWPAQVVWDGALALSITSASPWAVVFDHKPDAVCVEPQTAPPNAVELGLAATVTPDAPLSMQMSWTWHEA
jgi:aldose 1-epimerase